MMRRIRLYNEDDNVFWGTANPLPSEYIRLKVVSDEGGTEFAHQLVGALNGGSTSEP